MAKVDPFVIQWPQKWMADNEIRPVIEYLNRFLHDLFIRTGGGTDAVEASTSIQTDTGRLTAQLARLEKRVQAVEDKDIDGINSKIARLNRLVNALLNTLIEEIQALNNVDIANKALSLQSRTLAELELLNTRLEEAFETGLDIGDTE